MPTGVELATAWVRLVPTMEGVQGAVAQAFAPAQKEATAQGAATGSRWTAGTKKAMVVGGAAIAAGVVASFAGLYKIGDTFDEVTDTIRVKTGATGKQLDGLTKIAKNVGTSVPADFKKIGPVVADLNQRLGLSGKTLETVSKQYLEAGRILGEDVDIKTTTGAFNAFGLEGKEVAKGMDTLFQVAQSTGVSMNDLAGTVKQAAPALKNLGFNFQETAAFAGTLDKAGINSKGVLAGMSKGLVTLAKAGENPQDAFKRTTKEIQAFVKEGDTASALNLASKVFGTKGATQFVGAIQSGKLNMEDLTKATAGSGDTILKAGKDTADFAEKAKVLGNQAMVALEPLATTVFNAMGDALTFAMPYITAFGDWAKNNTGILAGIAAVIGVILVAALVSYAVSAVVAAAATWALAAPFLAAALPVLAIIAAFALLVVAAILIRDHWAQITDFLKTVWGAVVDWVLGTLKNLHDFWISVWTSITDFFIGLWNGVVSWFMGLWNGLVALVRAAIALIVANITDRLNLIKAVWSAAWTWVSTTASAVWNTILAGVTAFVNFIRDAIRSGMSLMTTIWSNAWTGLKAIPMAVWSFIDTKVFTPLKDGVGLIAKSFENGATAIGKAWDKIKSAAGTPVNFVLDTIWNNGLRSFWNGVMGDLGLGNLKLPAAKLVKFANGGVLPGYTPGRDVHQFYSPTGGNLALSGGEAIMRPEFTRAVGGKAGVDRLNQMARSGQAFADGGIWGGIKGVASSVWNTTKNIADSAADFASDPKGAIQERVIDGILKPLMANVPGGKIGQGIAQLPLKMATAMMGKSFVPKGQGVAGEGWAKMWATVHKAFPNMVMTSNLRSAAQNASVGGAKGSYHTLGRAIDLIPASMDTFHKIKGLFPNASELIYTPAGMEQLRNGKPFAAWSAAVRAQHYNHVHLAMKNGGVFPGLASGGTITGAGTTLVGENGPELLTLPKGAQVDPDFEPTAADRKGVTFNNYAPLGKTPAQALTEFSNRAKGL